MASTVLDCPSRALTRESSKPLLLRLPYTIRRRIYEMIGLILPSGIDYCPFPERSRTWTTAWSSRDQKLSGVNDERILIVSNQLFYVSRDVSSDALAAFYSENVISLAGYGLWALNKLGSVALKSMASLQLSLTTFECPVDCSFASETDSAKLEHPCKLYVEDPSNREDWPCEVLVAQELRENCTKLTAHIKPGHLKLCIILTFPKATFFHEVLSAIVKLPLLKECSVYAATGAPLRFQQLVERTALQATGQIKSYPPFPFNDLPTELQMRILEHAGLLAPDIVARNCCRGYVLQTCVLNGIGCRCAFGRVAYNSNNPCWKLPISFFQLNRRIRELSQYLFFSGNRFYLGGCPHCGCSRRENLSDISEDCLHHIQFLTLGFPVINKIDTYLPGTRTMESWLNTLNDIARHMIVSKLVLALHFECSAGPWDSHLTLDPSDITTLAVFQRVVQPLVQLEGLKDLFLHIEQRTPQDAIIFLNEQEAALEQMVMGASYDSLARGKGLMRPHTRNLCY
ncbi:hypothetical protein PRK78_002337 [Emydomyces testavorans]|uniref:Uncharacterized protein n=1 Tax=Emydomyces testavorans TaxID=2070801 RepID=A0AAF0DE48_9EURO|nr:hypothetical protein PRK78_002337 [Emydomyces testavorans]